MSSRNFAPVYRQITVAGLGGVAGEDARELAYGDVVDAWKQYVSTDNEGRGSCSSATHRAPVT